MPTVYAPFMGYDWRAPRAMNNPIHNPHYFLFENLSRYVLYATKLDENPLSSEKMQDPIDGQWMRKQLALPRLPP